MQNRLWSIPSTPGRRPGTVQVISDLNEHWTYDKLRKIAREQLSRLMNPFFQADFRVVLQFNNEPIDLLEMQRDVLERARFHIEGTVDPDTSTSFSLTVRRNGERLDTVIPSTFEFPPRDALRKVGPFRFEFYEFDRNDRSLDRLSGQRIVARFLDDWGGGGPMLFRDGFRVMPYGTPGNDWLEIDKAFFREWGGTRLRTHAMTGYVAITSDLNTELRDQTNREGLRETPAYEVFVDSLKQLVKLINLQLQRLTTPPPTSRPERDAKVLSETGDQLNRTVRTAIKTVTQLRALMKQNEQAVA